MSFLKKQRVFLFLIFLVYASFLLTHLFSVHQKFFGTRTNVTLFEQPEAGKAPLLTALAAAQKEILVEVYLLSDKDIMASLEDATARGVQVKVLLEQHPFGVGNSNITTEQILKEHHIQVAWTNPDFALTHEKAIVIDNAEAFILNQNLTAAAFIKNREYDIKDTNAADILEIRNMFIADWERTSFIPSDPALVISPKNSRDGITQLLQSATQSIAIEVEDIADTQVEKLLAEKAKEMSVKLLVPTLSQVASNKSALDVLQKSGVSVKQLSAPYIHAKLIVVDNTKAYVGSVNLSTQSMDENRELGIIIENPDVVATLAEDFTADWQK